MASEEENKASFKNVNLTGTKITGLIDMDGASFDGMLDACSLQVGGDLSMTVASFKNVFLRHAKVKGLIGMDGAKFDGWLVLTSTQVDGHLFMRSDGQNNVSLKDVFLRFTKIAGVIDMSGASIDGLLYADALQVDGDVGLQDARCTQKVVMVFAHVGSSLDLRGATLADVDLSGASVGGDLRLGGAHKSTVWTGKNGEPGALSLHNTHIANLADATDAWRAQG
jgi:uncharacterized protein YjbI with pentapeptide repeats